MKQIFNLYLFFAVILLPLTVLSQEPDSIPVFDYSETKEYEIGKIEVTGATYSDDNTLISIAGLKVGDKIRIGPGGSDIPSALKKLWRLKLFTDVKILKTQTIGEVIFLQIAVQERPSLSRHSFRGVKKAWHDDINASLSRFLLKGAIVTENNKTNCKKEIEKFYEEKGYFDATVDIEEIPDEKRINAVRLEFVVDPGERIKIQDITFSGNENVKPKRLRKLLKNTKPKRRLLASSKFIKPDYEGDKKEIIYYYNTLGYRDAQILSDSIWRSEDGDLFIHINLEEGNKYYFRNIVWKGNSIYTDETLSAILGIEKGDVYNEELLETRLSFSMDGRDVSTLYMDNGYLFFQANPTETSIEGDSIDLAIVIFEGPQATIDRVVIRGNDRTHEHVIRRELRTRPGEKFSRTDIIRSQREIVNLGYFNPETLGINTPVNPQRGTVDIEYTVEEKPSDQLELSAGWGGRGRGVIGTLGVSFNNFSLRNMFKKGSWSPLPQGDGQRLSLRAQTNGRFFQSYNISFTEPWLGGKQPTSFSVSGFFSRFTNGGSDFSTTFQSLNIGGVTVGLGTRLKFPDDNFISNTALNLQVISLNNWTRGLFFLEDGTPITDGKFNNFSITQTITRSSVSEPIFPRSGSRISLSAQLTFPYSIFRDTESMSPQERLKWLEYHKWRLNAEWYTTLVGKLVLKASAKIGILGFYNETYGLSPFERFELGGDGLSNQTVGVTGKDIISLRGYDVGDLPANSSGGASVFDKMTVELRYPLSLNPSSTIYVLAFAEGGNSWKSLRDFNPFDFRRSVGGGLRVFLPMFGVLGFDYGFGIDKPLLNSTNASAGDYARFSIILGFEPE